MRRRQRFAELYRQQEECRITAVVEYESIVCEMCKREFKSKHGLKVHMGRAHGNTD